jgi:NTP pyrophosphatase (non-canonical NTP hydrolase)
MEVRMHDTAKNDWRNRAIDELMRDDPALTREAADALCTEVEAEDARPSHCHFRLAEEGKSFPKSACEACGRTIATGLGKVCSFMHSAVPAPAPPPDITLWKPEPDVVLHQALAKLAEELGELTQIVGRCLNQGYSESDPKTGQHNYVRLREEMCDVLAVIGWLAQLRDELDVDGAPRTTRKLDGFLRWQAMLEADIAAGPKPLGWRIVNTDRHTVMWDYDRERVTAFRNAHHAGMAIEPMWSHTGDAAEQEARQDA